MGNVSHVNQPRPLLAPPLLHPAAGRSGIGFNWRFQTHRASAETEDFESGNILNQNLRTPKMARVEAVLLIAGGAFSTRKLAQYATLADPTEARTVIKKLNDVYDRCGTPFRIEQVAAGYQMLTRAEYTHWLDKLHHRQAELKLTPGQMETLAIVAYRQPIIRADVEAIRGVACVEMLKQLMDRGLVKIGGADDTLGRPHLYETTRLFLETFGLRSVDDLPMYDKLSKKSPPATEAPTSDAA
ncbi:MAG: SMC-Scp complex subunit ScpB [Planctomycetaceae bacterium]|nr:SMC-Scp complex subunit ScpB [Planctomycetaceae bacterium]